MRTLEEADACANDVVAAAAADPAPLLYISPYSACTIGEFFRDSGGTRWSCMTTSRSMRRLPRDLVAASPAAGREAYPASLLPAFAAAERAAKLNATGGGSLTALPIIETQQATCPRTYRRTSSRSKTANLSRIGSVPPGRPAGHQRGNSVSRVGGAAQIKASARWRARCGGPGAVSRAAAFAQFGRTSTNQRRRSSRAGRGRGDSQAAAVRAALGRAPGAIILPAPTAISTIFLSRTAGVRNRAVQILDNRYPELFRAIAEKKQLDDPLRGRDGAVRNSRATSPRKGNGRVNDDQASPRRTQRALVGSASRRLRITSWLSYALID